MTPRQELIVSNADKYKEMVYAAERWLWQHPHVGYTEWENNEYIIDIYEKLGYKLVRADQDPKYGKIPGFYTEIDTGKPGPTLAIMGELDALDIGNHPESVNGMCHCCGHHAQSATMIGIAAALKEPGALDGLCGKIRLYLVPAEELIQLTFREELRKQGVIKYFGGKVEFLYRGYFDGVDLSLMVHGSTAQDADITCGLGGNGFVAKTSTYRGRSSHAAGNPSGGINAQYAAMVGIQACNSLRETYKDKDCVRSHPIMKGVQSAVNIIPDEMKIENLFRARTMDVVKAENIKINRAMAAGAAAMGAKLEICDRAGYCAEYHDPAFMRLVEECCIDLVGEDRVKFDYEGWTTGSSDFGDLTSIMPGIQFNCSGASGLGHGTNYYVTDPNKLCMNSVKAQLFVADALLSNDAEKAKKIIADYQPTFKNIAEYLEFVDSMNMDKDAVIYNEDGTITLDYQN